jgi:lipopolysaccharide export system permease protein
MKKIDKLVFGAFLGPFLMTFLVVVFILLMQHMLKYFDDIIGKGLGWDVIGQLLFYFAIFMTPVALPLAVLLSSLIAFGNLGEHFELTAIKSAGISLVRALVPIFIFVIFLTFAAFYANNNLVPKAALEAYSLLYDIKQKKPALDLREGAFYNGINDISIKVNKKFPDGITIKDVVVYDHRKSEGNREVTVADSGKMYTILNERYLKFELFNGYNYAQTSAQREVEASRGRGKISGSESFSRRKFSKSQIVFDLSSFKLERTEKRWFQGNRIMRNLTELTSDMDSITTELKTQRLNYYEYQPSYFSLWLKDDYFRLPPDLEHFKKTRDSLQQIRYTAEYNRGGNSAQGGTTNKSSAVDSARIGTDSIRHDSLKVLKKDTTSPRVTPTTPTISAPKKAAARQDQIVKSKIARNKRFAEQQRKKDRMKQSAKKPGAVVESNNNVSKPPLSDSARAAKLDSLFDVTKDRGYYEAALTAVRQVKTQIVNSNASVDSYEKEWITFDVQWHKILASSLACIAMFMIGAPLGAIIKKGGLGMPFLVSILFFIIYYILTMQGEKLAKQGTISPAMGVWMADFVLFAVGLIFLRQARADARLFEADFYNVLIDKARRWFLAGPLGRKGAK